jgi:hypothetical protein
LPGFFLPGRRVFLPLGLCGVGFVWSIFFRTSSRDFVMAIDPPDESEKDQLAAIGAIITLFARIEAGMEIAIAAFTDVEMWTVLVMTSDSGYRQKRAILQTVSQYPKIPRPSSKKFEKLLNAIHKRTKIRNLVAHATWANGRRPGSIKPVTHSIRSGKPKTKGHRKNEKDYTAADFWEEANKIRKVASDLQDFLVESGFLDAIQKKIARMSDTTSGLPGNPSSK